MFHSEWIVDTAAENYIANARIHAHHKRLRLIHWLLGVVFTLIAGIACVHADSSAQSIDNNEKADQITFHNGRLSVSTGNITIPELLELIGRKAGFKIVTYGDLGGQRKAWSISDLPLAQALEKLLKNTNAIITYRGDQDSNGEQNVSTIYLLASGSNSAETSLVRINTIEPSLKNQTLIDQARLDDPEDRVLAIDRLKGRNDELSIASLAFALRHDPDPVVRSQAVIALESIGDAAAISALEGGLGDDEPSVRTKVVQAFGRIPDQRTELWLGQVLMGDPSADVRLQAVKAIASKRGDTAQIFLEAATGDSSEIVSEAALQLLR